MQRQLGKAGEWVEGGLEGWSVSQAQAQARQGAELSCGEIGKGPEVGKQGQDRQRDKQGLSCLALPCLV
jgi:hypothetical protein